MLDWLKPRLSFKGNGKVSVPVSDILASPKVQDQVAAVRELWVRSWKNNKVREDRFRAAESYIDGVQVPVDTDPYGWVGWDAVEVFPK